MSNKWLHKADIYRWFGREYATLDWSLAAAQRMYDYESRGGGVIAEDNGYLHGKRMMDLMQREWSRDIGMGLLAKHELTTDSSFPDCVQEWIASWLSSVAAGVHALAGHRR